MSVNKDRPHVLILPEDDANRQLANGFALGIEPTRARRLQVLPVAGGWNKVLNVFEAEQAALMDRWPLRFLILLIDFDNKPDRLAMVKERIPPHLSERVFILGALGEPEGLRRDLGRTHEEIGMALANDCRDDQTNTWGSELLKHNADEANRLNKDVRPILFGNA